MVHMIQVLCPKRHCILAIAYDPESTSPDDAMAGLRAHVDHLLAQRAINPWCGICGSRQWAYEDRESIFKTMEEATPVLRERERQQALARAALGVFNGNVQN